ncbi:MAG: cyclic nucleotide-binding domain-containing protein [Anaerolineales bacterium]|jgi:hypothetical protein
MKFSSAFDLLCSTHFLRQEPEDDMRALAATLKRETYEAGTVVIHQGSRPKAMYFIAEGEVEVVHKHPERGEDILAKLKAGDTFGEIEMIYTQSRFATVRAALPTIVYRWDRLAMTDFMKQHPAALASLRFAVQSRRLARKVRFDWLADDEVIYGLARKHNVLLFQSLTLPMFLLATAALLIIYGLVREQTVISWVGAVMLVSAFALAVWRWIDWSNDYYIVTNRRAVWLEKIVGIYDSRVEAPLHMLLSVSVSTEMVGRMMDYGDVVIRTYTGKVVFRNVENPAAMAAIIEEHWQRLRTQQEQTDRESLRDAVRQRLAPEPEPEEQSTVEIEKAPMREQTESRPGLFHSFFKVRYEEQDVITYRKHWAVLLREIAAPSILILITVILLAAGFASRVTFLPTATFITLVVLLQIVLVLWWWYRYVDWSNDIYQITPEQIVDVYKKPLSREVRKVAPLENVLSTEVDRKGVLGYFMNYGDVVTNIGTAMFVFEGVFDPVGVQQDIVHAQEALIQRQHEMERKQRQSEMVELLDIYHDEYSNVKKFPESEEDQNHGYP